MGPDGVFVGVLWFALSIPGARSLKDRRRAVVSLRDRVRARFDVSCHEVAGHDVYGLAELVITTGGRDPGTLGSLLDKIDALVASDAVCVITSVEREVRGWPDPEPWHDEEDDDV